MVMVTSKATSTRVNDSATSIVPTHDNGLPKILTPTPERFGVLSLLRVEQVSPIQVGQLMTVRASWRVGALPNVGMHQGLFTMQLIGPDGTEVAQSDVAPDGADLADGPRYVFDPGSLARVPAAWSLRLPAAEGARSGGIALQRGPGAVEHAFLLAYPGDDFATGQIQVLGGRYEGPTLLPLLMGGIGDP